MLFDAQIANAWVDLAIALGQRPCATTHLDDHAGVRWNQPQKVEIDALVVVGEEHEIQSIGRREGRPGQTVDTPVSLSE